MGWKKFAAVALALGVLGGCSVLDRLVYRIDINQGNYLEQKDINQLRLGMSKEQVQYILGTPMLIENGYPNTWYYVYWHKPGHDAAIEKKLVVRFSENGKLALLEGDFKPGEQFAEMLQ